MEDLATAALAAGDDADALYEAFNDWSTASGLTLYPHQDEAILELLSGSHVVLATPTGSGKSLVATAAHAAALGAGRRSFYTAPVKALVNEKFFALCDTFGAERVGMLTGDAAVNPDAPIIACTAEVLANIALRSGDAAAIGLVVMDEFHYYGEADRGWAWQIPLLELTSTQFLLMSATLGDVTHIGEDLTRRTGREVALVTGAERPVPLTFSWATEPLADTLDELVSTHQWPVYVVHFTQAAAVEHATTLVGRPAASRRLAPEQKAAIAEATSQVRFAAGFGRTLSKMLRSGIGVHHAGMLPRYRRLVEQLAQQGLLQVICGTDTLGVGINVPIRTVLFTGLVKFDGHRERILKVREFQQIAGRAGRAGFDTAGTVVVQAPEHEIENQRLLAKAGDDPKKRRKVQRRKAPDGVPVWTEETFARLVGGDPERLASRMRVDNAMLLNVVSRPEDAFEVMRRLLRDSHEDARSRTRLTRRALRLARSLLASGVLTRLEEPDEHGRRFLLTVDLPADFALNQPLAHFALEVLDLLDPDSPEHALDIVSVLESVSEAPRQVLMAQQHAARGEAIAEMKADGIDYHERMELLEEVTWPQPLADLLEPAYETYRESHPWLPPDALQPASVLRQMYEHGMGFTDMVSRYGLARSEGVLLRYLSNLYRTLRHTVEARHRSPVLDELTDWLGETVRQVDSSLLDEWEALSDPTGAWGRDQHEAPPPPRPLSRTDAFRRMVRNAIFARVLLAARDDVAALVALEREAAERVEPARTPPLTRQDWDEALDAYYAEHDEIGTGAQARGPDLFQVEEAEGTPPGAEGDQTGGLWLVRQVLDDPAGHHDWVIEATVDLAASDELGEPVLTVTSLRRL
ncbi:DEAD/DEAH box helicase [Nocardioides limicola]|uniref:DEAD/DEAH box helicase n=1 Tax=Nocardioides limicola TaxID=2803368 RepID=UPI0027DB962C|nr:DUF3516 domain-containing protein [Nocardioides sp. DJM-14]